MSMIRMEIKNLWLGKTDMAMATGMRKITMMQKLLSYGKIFTGHLSTLATPKQK